LAYNKFEQECFSYILTKESGYHKLLLNKVTLTQSVKNFIPSISIYYLAHTRQPLDSFLKRCKFRSLTPFAIQHLSSICV